MNLEYLKNCNLCESSEIISIDKGHNIYKCTNCGYIFDNPRPTFEQINNFYSKEDQYDKWLDEEKGRISLWKRRLKKIIKYRKKGKLLDVGTGIGQFLFFAKDYFDVSGTEISQSAINTAKGKYGLDIIKGQIENIDFKGKRFDVITLFHVLEHVSNPSYFINRCYELLNDQGILIIAVPNEITSVIKRPIKQLQSIIRKGKFKDYGVYGLPKIELNGSLKEIHLSHFSPVSLKKFIKRKNFEIVDESLDPYYSSNGISKLTHSILYTIFLFFKKITTLNLYDSIWITAKRK